MSRIKQRLGHTATLIIIVLLIPLYGKATQLTLQSAVDIAKQNHPLVKLAGTYSEEASADVGQRMSLKAPELSVRWDRIPMDQGLSGYSRYRVGFSQDIPFPLKYYWLTGIKKQTAISASARGQTVIAEMVDGVKQSYIETWAQGKKVDLLKAWRDSLTYISSEIGNVEAAGGISAMDARQLRLKAATAREECESEHQQLESSLAALAMMLNISQPIELADPFSTGDPYNIPMDSLNRLDSPEENEAKEEMLLWRSESKLAGYEWLPDLKLSYLFREELEHPGDGNWAIELSAEVPLWFWWGGKQHIDELRAREKRSQAEWEQVSLRKHTKIVTLAGDISRFRKHLDYYNNTLLPSLLNELSGCRAGISNGSSTYTELSDLTNRWKKAALEKLELEEKLCLKLIAAEAVTGSDFATKLKGR